MTTDLQSERNETSVSRRGLVQAMAVGAASPGSSSETGTP